LPAGIVVRVADDTIEDMHVLHTLHQDSFSSHFGFKPREFENWMALELEKLTRDPAGNYILIDNGTPAGFLFSATEMAHENGGYIDLIGVSHAHQGKGFGKLLLQCAAARARFQQNRFERRHWK
jgi:ribosomal protein S18 acetylase RimI-like enzyme